MARLEGAGDVDRVAARHDRRARSGSSRPSRPRCGCAAPSIREPLIRLVDRLHTRVPMPDALRRFADDLDDPSADLIIAALIINSRLRGPGLRDLLGALAGSVREELDMRRKVNAERRSTRRSVQIVVAVSVGMAVGLAVFDRAFLVPVRRRLGPGRAGPHRQPVRGRDLVAAQAGHVRVAAAAARRPAARRCPPPNPRPSPPGAGVPREPGVRTVTAMMPALVIGGADRAGPVPAGLRADTAPGQAGPADRRVRRGPARPRCAPSATRATARRARSARLGAALARFCAEQGWEFPSLRANLRLVGKSFENFLGTKVTARVLRADLPAVPAGGPRPAGMHLSFIVPVWVGLVFAAVVLLPARPGAAGRGGEAAQGLPARDRRVPRPGRDEPVRRPRRARGADGGQRDRRRLGVLADQGRAGQRQDHRPDAVAGARRARRRGPGRAS